MKKFFYLSALSLGMMCSITACSDDDDEPTWKKLPSQTISAENLTLTTNTQNFPNASVKLAMTDAQNGVLTLSNAIRGLNEVEIEVTVAEQADGSFKFQGEKNVGTTTKSVADLVSSTAVKVSGTVTVDGKADVLVTTAANGSLVKKWQLCDKLIVGDNAYAYSPFKLQWISPYGEGGNEGLAASNIQLIATPTLSSIMVKLLKDVEFKADGAIVANYAENVEIDQNEIISGILGGGNLPSTDGINWLTSPANLAYWYAGDDHIYVVLDIPAIVAKVMSDQGGAGMSAEAILGIVEAIKGMSGAEVKGLLGELLKNIGSDSILSKLDLTKISDADVEKLIGYVINGFPLSYQMSEVPLENESKVNNIYVYLDKGIFDIVMPLVYPLLPDLDTLVKGITIEMIGQQVPIWSLISGLTGLQSLTEIEPLWKATTQFNIGLDLGTGSYKLAK